MLYVGNIRDIDKVNRELSSIMNNKENLLILQDISHALTIIDHYRYHHAFISTDEWVIISTSIMKPLFALFESARDDMREHLVDQSDNEESEYLPEELCDHEKLTGALARVIIENFLSFNKNIPNRELTESGE